MSISVLLPIFLTGRLGHLLGAPQVGWGSAQLGDVLGQLATPPPPKNLSSLGIVKKSLVWGPKR